MNESLSVVFPMFNEHYYLRQTINMAREAIKKITNDYEIIIVDDASTDGSGEIADKLFSDNDRIKVVHNRKK